MNDETQSINIESHYAKQPDGFVYYYWRFVGSDTWNVQKTAMKEIPYQLAQPHNKEKGKE